MPDAEPRARVLTTLAFLAPLLTSAASVAQSQAPPLAGEVQSPAPSNTAEGTTPSASAAPAIVAAPPAALAAPPAPSTLPATGSARVRFAVNHADAWLETRPFGADGAWQKRCKAPCGDWLPVEDQEVRITAAGMTPSSVFRIEAGTGAALLKVNGGSALAQTLGRIGLIAGLPLSLAGMASFAYGHFNEERGPETVGAVTLALGAALVLTALPLLVAGSTSVRNEKGDLIAAQPAGASF